METIAFARLPTVYGKSLVYEMLPFISSNCLVISIIDQQIQKQVNRAMHLRSKSNLKELDNGDVILITWSF